ncbi:TM0996/MTH895 family glutaredoxin-like protein [Faecalicatena sp. AGMB00832]|uniref:TM0996/MTH895 family glutaredoxin-like protein n=1 Tax=Faecalicatena faecalis TaxID=2726362 RepID=A0ABS6D0M5_9FIRM|nr:thioredoxin family protein [Faecalicatena faecalis]MBU3875054.1 TM0996/MTH895 family glutaredoxin-like protein [Faecalicatena faecalis]
MALFGFGKKKEEVKETGCCCGGNCNAETMAKAEADKQGGTSVKVLGSGCAKCNELEAAAREALAELGMDTTIDHVTDFTQIAAYGVMTTPALVVDGKVVCFGKVLKKDEVVRLLREVRG